MMKLFIKFFRLSWREKRCLVLAFLVLHIIRLGLWRLPFQKLWRRVQHHSSQSYRWVHLFFPGPPPIAELIPAIDSSSWYTLRQARCLSRALTLYVLMKWFGYTPILRIGVAKPSLSPVDSQTVSEEQQPRIEAHAWVEHNNQVILGQIRDLGRFMPLPSIEQMK